MKKYILIVLVCVLLGGVVGALLWQTTGADSKTAVESLPPGEPVELAVIDGEPFCVEAGREALIMWSMLDDDISVSEQIKSVVEQEVVVRKAKEEGVTVSDDEVQAFIDEQLQTYRDCKDDEIAQEFYQMLDALGVTDEEFFAMFFEQYRNLMIEGKYRNLLTEKYETEAFERWEEYRAAGKEKTVTPDAQSYWQKFKADLIKKADIKYADEIKLYDLY